MKKLITATLLSASLMVPTIGFAVESSPNGQAESFLFVQVADSAKLAENKDKPGTYQLTLNHVKDDIEYFSDRPVRIAGKMSLTEFLTKWHKTFDQVPPNVGIVGIDTKSSSTKPNNFVMELSHPIYDAKSETFTYEAEPVPKGTPLPTELSFNGIALFIDDYCASCVASGF